MFSLSGIYDADVIYDIYIDVKKIDELSMFSVGDATLQIGTGTSLNSLIELLEKVAISEGDKFSFGTAMAKHIRKVKQIEFCRKRLFQG
jgi:hypothetical protein